MQIIVDTLVTEYQLTGQGKLVVLLHGWGSSSDNLQNIAENLSSKFQVLSIELPGFGRTQNPSKVYSLDDYSDFVNQVVNKLKLGDVYALIGHSNGGAISIKYANNYKCQKLVLIGASGIRSQDQFKKKLLALVSKLFGVIEKISPVVYNKVRKGFYQKIIQSEDYSSLSNPIMKKTIGKILAEDLEQQASRINLPVLLIYGQQDKATNSYVWQKYANSIPGSQLVIVPGAGHYVHIDEPSLVIHNIKEFL